LIDTNKQFVLALFCVSIGILLASWFITSKEDVKYTKLEESVAKLSDNISRFDSKITSLNAEIQHLYVAVSNNTQSTLQAVSTQTLEQVSDTDFQDTEPDSESGSSDYESMAEITTDAPSQQEIASVTLITDKLRARDMQTYPDFPSLMTSPEVSKLGPAALDKMMAEVARMFESGEIDSSFFPKQ